MPKPHGNDDEILLLISLKRKSALNAMLEILTGFGLERRIPSITALLEYLSNMVYCIELMLKLLSGNWQTHDVGKMYSSVFRSPHAKPQLMTYIGDTIKDQKYLFEPATGIASHIPEMEVLFDQLKVVLMKRFEKFAVEKTYELPIAFAEYLRDRADRFYRKEGPSIVASSPPSDPGALKERLIQESHSELMKIRQVFDQFAKGNSIFEFHEFIISMNWLV